MRCCGGSSKATSAAPCCSGSALLSRAPAAGAADGVHEEGDLRGAMLQWLCAAVEGAGGWGS